MLELASVFPAYVTWGRDIPNYAEMNDTDKSHYRGMYSAVCKGDSYDSLRYTDSNNIKALIYFIFYYNIAYLPSGAKIIPLLKFFWSQQTGFQMTVQTDNSNQLLPTLNLLTTMPPVYFAALMLSMALFQRYDPNTPEYQVCFELLEALLMGQYAAKFKQIKPAFVSQSDYGWFFHSLPKPEKFDFSTILSHDKVTDVRTTLIGGIFPRPERAARTGTRCSIM